MNGIPNRVVRLVALLSVTAVSILGSTQAMAAAPINYYEGSANGTALAVVAAPSALLDVKLAAVKSILDQLATATGIDLNTLVGPTLADATKPINVVVDQAHSAGKSATGLPLSDGTSTTTPVSIDAASLTAALAALKAALHNIPAGAVTQLTNLLGNPLLANANLAPVLAALNQIAGNLADTLGNPAVNAFDSATVNFGQLPNPVNEGNLTTGPSFITNGPFVLGPFSAEALPKDSAATNTLTSLVLAATGNIGIPSAAQIQTLLNTIATTLATLETALGNVVNVLPAGLGSLLGGTLQTVTGNLNAGVQSAIAAVNTAYGTLNTALSNALNALGVLDGLKLNDLLGTGPSTALSSLSRDLTGGGGMVSSNGLSNLAHVDVLKLSNPALAGLLTSVSKAAGGSLPVDLTKTSLVSVDGVKGVAAVTADGVHPTTESYTGQLLDVHVLGQSLKAITGSLDAILPPGTACIIQVPGTINCPGLLGGQAAAGLDALNTVLGKIPTSISGLLTITLTRGANSAVGLTGPNAQQGAASIVTLEVNVAIDCSKIPGLSALGSLTDQLKAAGISLCSGAAASAAKGARATAASSGSASLVDVQLGQADAVVSLTPGGASLTSQQCVQGDAACPVRIPSTGNNILILAAFGLILAAAGIGLNRKRIPFRRS